MPKYISVISSSRLCIRICKREKCSEKKYNKEKKRKKREGKIESKVLSIFNLSDYEILEVFVRILKFLGILSHGFTI